MSIVPEKSAEHQAQANCTSLCSLSHGCRLQAYSIVQPLRRWCFSPCRSHARYLWHSACISAACSCDGHVCLLSDTGPLCCCSNDCMFVMSLRGLPALSIKG